MARWFAMSTQFLTDPKVEVLGERHGPAGPLVVVALLSQAMLQEAGGTVERTYRSLANDAFTDRETVQAVISDAVESRLVTLDESDDLGVTVTFPAWKRHQANFRKARSRAAEKPHEKADVTAGHAESRPVPKSHSQDRTGEEKTGQEKKTSAVPAADAPLSHLLADLVAANDPNGKRPNVTKRWAEEEDRLIRLDGRRPEEAERLIRWTQADSFWRGNVLSMPKFREKYTQLYQAAVKDSQRKSAPGIDQAHRFAELARQAEAEEARAAA